MASAQVVETLLTTVLLRTPTTQMIFSSKVINLLPKQTCVRLFLPQVLARIL